MSYSTCIRGGGLCTGCMACQGASEETRDRYDEYREEVTELIEYYDGGWELLCDLVKNANLIREFNVNFAQAAEDGHIEGDVVVLGWRDGDEIYHKEEVEEWEARDFSDFLGVWYDDLIKMGEVLKRQHKF